MIEVCLPLRDPDREPFGKLVTTAILLVLCCWAALYVVGYGPGVALLLAWLSSGVLLPALGFLKLAWPRIATRFSPRKTFLGNQAAQRPMRPGRQ